MNKKCDACDFLANPDPAVQILETKFWSVGLGPNQAYFGRAYMTLRNHKENLSSLSDEEWEDYRDAVRKLEKVYKDLLGAEPLNWSCCMNHAFREEPFNPHVHWHIYPRYSKVPEIDGVEYPDENFGNMYVSTKERMVDGEIVEKLAARLRNHLQ